MSITVAQLYQVLHDRLAEGTLCPDDRVVIGTQPRYPFGCTITGHCVDSGYRSYQHSWKAGAGHERVLVLTEGAQECHGNTDWWSGLDLSPDLALYREDV